MFRARLGLLNMQLFCILILNRRYYPALSVVFLIKAASEDLSSPFPGLAEDKTSSFTFSFVDTCFSLTGSGI